MVPFIGRQRLSEPDVGSYVRKKSFMAFRSEARILGIQGRSILNDDMDGTMRL